MRHLGWMFLRERVERRLAKMLKTAETPSCPVCAWVRSQLSPQPVSGPELRRWFLAYRPGKKRLGQFRSRHWPAIAPSFTVLLPVVNPTLDRLRQAILSVQAQTYPSWALACVGVGAVEEKVRNLLSRLTGEDPRILFLHQEHEAETPCDIAVRHTRGDYVCFLDENDALEPHALHRFAEAILADRPDMLYSDEVTTGPDLEDIRSVATRPPFSYDYYLGHAYFMNLIGIRAALLARVARCPPQRMPSLIDLVLRVLEKARTVSHVPDILYRRRTALRTATPEAPCQDRERQLEHAVATHLACRGWRAKVETGMLGIRKITFSAAAAARVAILIPTHNHGNVLRTCLESLQRTVPPDLADVHVLNHNSDDPETLRYLRHLPERCRVTDVAGPFNFSALLNQGVRQLPRPYSHYLFLNNDTEALAGGWLEHMVGLASRPDVGIVGALLLYPDGSVQHGGVLVGLNGGADHLGRFQTLSASGALRPPHLLLCTRDVSAVTGACLLTRADVYARAGGLDERFAVGFGDTDFCLRVRDAGYHVLFDPHARLLHHESMTRGKSEYDPHPDDTRLFISRYAALIQEGDLCYSPLWARSGGQEFTLVRGLRSPMWVQPRTVHISRSRSQPGDVVEGSGGPATCLSVTSDARAA